MKTTVRVEPMGKFVPFATCKVQFMRLAMRILFFFCRYIFSFDAPVALFAASRAYFCVLNLHSNLQLWNSLRPISFYSIQWNHSCVFLLICGALARYKPPLITIIAYISPKKCMEKCCWTLQLGLRNLECLLLTLLSPLLKQNLMKWSQRYIISPNCSCQIL